MTQDAHAAMPDIRWIRGRGKAERL